jgi:hypothetical protein
MLNNKEQHELAEVIAKMLHGLSVTHSFKVLDKAKDIVSDRTFVHLPITKETKE